MKRIVLAALIATGLMITQPALASVALTGKFKAKITSSALGGQLKGTWILNFKNSGYLVGTRNGKSAGRARYSVKGQRLTIHAGGACSSSGTYKVHRKGKKLRFTRISDPCPARRLVFSYTYTALAR